jgi:N-acetylmuramoyl-L-alanine amidase
VVFDLSAAAQHKVFTLSNPERVVVDIDGIDVAAARKADRVEGRGAVQRVRTGRRGPDQLRVVLDVSQAVVTRSFALEPTEEYGHRLVIDLGNVVAAAPAATVTATAAAPPASDTSIGVVEKPIVVAIDAGHGGEDPGARGRSGLLEKDVTLSISRRLARLIDAEPGMKAVLTRDGDYYVGLRERVQKARSQQADLFVSVHANAYKDRDMHGSAVYTLSNRGATSEQARWLANKENAADLVGGIELHGKDDDLAKVLIDLSQDATMEASFDLGERVLKAMGRVNTLQRRAVQQAGFAVLKAPDIPSVLVETAFITNSREEKMLRDKAQQEIFASAIFEGIKGYFSAYRPYQQVAEREPRLIKVSNDPR